MRALLGPGYAIYRVAQGAMLDEDIENAWNCVAISRGQRFETLLRDRICVA